MSLEVTCSCGRKLRVAAGAAGQRGRCPVCGSELEIPALDDLSPRSPPAGSEAHLLEAGARRLLPTRGAGRLTEDEWLSCSDPLWALDQLDADGRRLRLFVCACCRRMADLLSGRALSVIDVGERMADGSAAPAEVAEAREVASWDARGWMVAPAAALDPAEAAREAVGLIAQHLAEEARALAWQNAAWDEPSGEVSDRAADRAGLARDAELKEQCALLRDIFGWPARLPRLDPRWLEWDDGAVRKVARGIYDDRAFSRMDYLVECLRRAGCADAELLTHLRSPGPHVRGCWALDLILGVGI